MKIPRYVGELMSRDVLCVTEDQDFRDVENPMRLFKFRHMPVTDDRRLVGLVTQRDLLRVSASSLLPGAPEQTAHLAKEYRIRDVMTRTPRAVEPETPLVEAARLMQHEKLGCLPVVNGDNVVVGILTEADFVRLVKQILENEDQGSSERLSGEAHAGRASLRPTLASLTSEHVVIRRALAALGAYAKRLETDPKADVQDLVRFAEFFETFVELWHHGKEEDILLPALVTCGFGWDSGPVARVRKDHDQENYLSRVLSQAAAQSATWTAQDRRQALDVIRNFIEFELEHMDREESVLYKAAAERLSAEIISDMDRRFSELEARTFATDTYEEVRRRAEELFERLLVAPGGR